MWLLNRGLSPHHHHEQKVAPDINHTTMDKFNQSLVFGHSFLIMAFNNKVCQWPKCQNQFKSLMPLNKIRIGIKNFAEKFVVWEKIYVIHKITWTIREQISYSTVKWQETILCSSSRLGFPHLNRQASCPCYGLHWSQIRRKDNIIKKPKSKIT